MPNECPSFCPNIDPVGRGNEPVAGCVTYGTSGGVFPLDSIGRLGWQIEVLTSRGKERGQPVATGDELRRLAIEYRPLAR